MSGNPNTNYGSTAERVPEVGFSGNGSTYDQKEADALSENVSKIIYSINNDRVSLEKSMKHIGTSKDSQELREKMQNTLVSINDKVTKATSDIKLLNKNMRRGGWYQKLQVQKITETFQESIQMCKPIEELVVAKMRCHMLPSELAILEQNQNHGRGLDTDQLTTSEMRQATEIMEFETGMLREREEKMAKIANTIIDINQIMKEIGAQIYKQGGDVDMIENAIEDVHQHVEAANEELQKASTYQISLKGFSNSEKDANEEVAYVLDDNSNFPVCDFYNNNIDTKDSRKLDTGRRTKTCILLAISVMIGVILTIVIALSLRDKKN